MRFCGMGVKPKLPNIYSRVKVGSEPIKLVPKLRQLVQVTTRSELES
jgi:hypothetical protein